MQGVNKPHMQQPRGLQRHSMLEKYKFDLNIHKFCKQLWVVYLKYFWETQMTFGVTFIYSI